MAAQTASRLTHSQSSSADLKLRSKSTPTTFSAALRKSLPPGSELLLSALFRSKDSMWRRCPLCQFGKPPEYISDYGKWRYVMAHVLEVHAVGTRKPQAPARLHLIHR